MAGHSKWANIKHKKNIKDKKKSKLFSKLIKNIKVSIEKKNDNFNLKNNINKAIKNNLSKKIIKNITKNNKNITYNIIHFIKNKTIISLELKKDKTFFTEIKNIMSNYNFSEINEYLKKKEILILKNITINEQYNEIKIVQILKNIKIFNLINDQITIKESSDQFIKKFFKIKKKEKIIEYQNKILDEKEKVLINNIKNKISNKINIKTLFTNII